MISCLYMYNTKNRSNFTVKYGNLEVAELIDKNVRHLKENSSLLAQINKYLLSTFCENLK